MTELRFPKPFVHEHPPVQDVNEIVQEQTTFGQRAADAFTKAAGSWTFILAQSVFLLLWAVLNVVAWARHWDPYPFILMNLVLSIQAAYTGPIILMSEKREAAKDRIAAHNAYLINLKAETESRAILEQLAAQDVALTEIHRLIQQLRQQPPSREETKQEP